jgi:hypothetical protein
MCRAAANNLTKTGKTIRDKMCVRRVVAQNTNQIHDGVQETIMINSDKIEIGMVGEGDGFRSPPET